MPTPIKDKASMHKAKDQLLGLTRRKRRTIHYVDFLLLYWDRDTIDMVNTVKSIVNPRQLDAHSPTVRHTMAVTHTVFPEVTNLNFSLDIYEPVNTRVLWPQGFALRHDCDMEVRAKIEGMFDEIGAEALERGLFTEVCEFLIDEGKTYEAAAYLCPPFVSLMRRAGLRELANSCEGDVQRVPNLPALPYLMRQKIRYVNEWFAIQELLGTWDSTERTVIPDDHIEVTLAGNCTFVKEWEGAGYNIRLAT